MGKAFFDIPPANSTARRAALAMSRRVESAGGIHEFPWVRYVGGVHGLPAAQPVRTAFQRAPADEVHLSAGKRTQLLLHLHVVEQAPGSTKRNPIADNSV
jgi:hypothetical protein